MVPAVRSRPSSSPQATVQTSFLISTTPADPRSYVFAQVASTTQILPSNAPSSGRHRRAKPAWRLPSPFPLTSHRTRASQSTAPSPGRSSPLIQTASKLSSGSTTSMSTSFPSSSYVSSFPSLLLLRREDVVAACFHSWLLIMSVTALMAESIPHIGTSFALHIFALFWSALQVWATQKFAGDYVDVISSEQGACGTVDVISGYFQERATYQIATLVVNFVSALASAFLCWRLFGVRTIIHFRRGRCKLSLFFSFRGTDGLHSRRWVQAARFRVPTSVPLHSLFASNLRCSSTSPLLESSWMRLGSVSSAQTQNTESCFSSATRSLPPASFHGCMW